ncbi:MAG TPA: DNA polymerase III subunit epsilon [Dongiaceae bacterium]|jgi:DNA polymerase-3 subunit epsilon|nr:DNA polymerase III subunit epsilon [Dongiaceae bacterium]
MREIVLDTETTGLDPRSGHRLVEIGCIELFNRIPTGKQWHTYLNPGRDVPEEALRVHGLSATFLRSYPAFEKKAEELLLFLGDAPLVAHNADFDVAFLNWELGLCGHPLLEQGRVIDSLKLARERFPGALVGLDALCRRFNIDNTRRTLHGALLDAQLLAEVYLELTGGRQTSLVLATENTATSDLASPPIIPSEIRVKRPHTASPEELIAHRAFLAKLVNPIWES